MLPGAKTEIRIERDGVSVPLITAGDDEDAFSLGFVHAQQRLFQMQLQQRGEIQMKPAPRPSAVRQGLKKRGLSSPFENPLEKSSHRGYVFWVIGE